MTVQPTDQLIAIEDSTAGWALFHPVSLRSRQKHPAYWWDYPFAISKEFSKGNLVAVVADFSEKAIAAFRVGTLTEKETLYLIDSAVFRLRVNYGLVVFAPLDQLPYDRAGASESQLKEAINLPNGNYRVTVNTIAWSEEPGAVDENGNRQLHALTDYVICFETAETFDAILVPDEIPHLMTTETTVPVERIIPRFEDDCLSSPYPFILLGNQIPLPGVSSNLMIPVEGHGALVAAVQRQDWSIVVSTVDTCPGIGVVFAIKAVEGDLSEPGTHEVSGMGVKAVRLKGFAKGLTGWFADVTLLHQPSRTVGMGESQPSRGITQKVRSLFRRVDRMMDEGFSAADPYEIAEKIELFQQIRQQFIRLMRQENYPYPEFSTERIKAIESLNLLTYTIADELGFDINDRMALLNLTAETDRAKMVLKRLARLLPAHP